MTIIKLCMSEILPDYFKGIWRFEEPGSFFLHAAFLESAGGSGGEGVNGEDAVLGHVDGDSPGGQGDGIGQTDLSHGVVGLIAKPHYPRIDFNLRAHRGPKDVQIRQNELPEEPEKVENKL